MKNGEASGSSGFRMVSAKPIVEEDRLLTAVETARFLNLKNVGTVYHMVHAKRLPVIRLSARCIRFSRRALLEWVQTLTQEAEQFPEG
jgi:excisionase family DNA binding protein